MNKGVVNTSSIAFRCGSTTPTSSPRQRYSTRSFSRPNFFTRPGCTLPNSYNTLANGSEQSRFGTSGQCPQLYKFSTSHSTSPSVRSSSAHSPSASPARVILARMRITVSASTTDCSSMRAIGRKGT